MAVRLLWLAGLLGLLVAAAGSGLALPLILALCIVSGAPAALVCSRRFDLEGGVAAVGVLWVAIAFGAIVPFVWQLAFVCANAWTWYSWYSSPPIKHRADA